MGDLFAFESSKFGLSVSELGITTQNQFGVPIYTWNSDLNQNGDLRPIMAISIIFQLGYLIYMMMLMK